MRVNYFKTILAFAVLFAVGCSTTAGFKVPDNTQLYINGEALSKEQMIMYKRSPFFWNKARGIPYRLEKNGKVVEEGKLKSQFRVVSIFWPPVALIYWPMGFSGPYDFTSPNDRVRPHKN